MANYYLSTFQSSDRAGVAEVLNSLLPDVKIEINSDKYFLYSTDLNIKKIPENDLLRNTFIVIKKFDKLTGNYFKPIFQWGGRHNFEDILPTTKSMGYKSFRLILSEKFRVISGHRRAVKALERQISKQTGLKIDRVSPSTEIWILHTKEDYGFVMLKINK
jgi:hypothetical protein